ncbi:efflux RND transporter periplasmic adaptor subunit [bacterium]|nr:efflux RND transporter periplasmic adaptor subunit [bacterium]
MNTIEKKIRLLLIPLILMAVSCGNGHNEKRSGTAGRVREYKVMEIGLQSTTLYKDYPALLEGQQTVEIRPKIAGYIEQILVDEGAYVKKGQLLFRLNDKDLQAAVRSSEALVKVAEADVYSAKVNLDKTKPLVDKSIISKFDLESAESTLKAKEAQLAQAQANMENAKENLQYTLITSPAEGTIGTFPYRMGSLVSSGIAEPLTTVSNTARVYAYFSLNEKEFLNLVKGLPGKHIQEKMNELPEVQLLLADNTPYDQPGKIETASGLVDQQTGAVTMRATFNNPEGLLHSGGSGLIRIPQFVDSAIIIPQKTTYELQGKRFVFTVTPDNKVHDTEIEVLAGNLKDTYVVTSGLTVGDKIVMEGIVSLRNDTEIKPMMVKESGALSEGHNSTAGTASQVNN